MAEQKPGDGAGTSESSGTGSDSFVMLNVKTLDSRIYSFHVEKDMPVTSFKQKIADQIGLPVAQQRLIFRGKVLKDETFLSEYHVETGDTLHLVERQLGQSQSSSGPSSGETNVNSNSQGNNASVAATQSRPGQISHSVVLGTLNVGDFGESVVPEISRVIGAVLNSLGVNNQNAAMLGQHSAGLNASSQVPPSNEAESGPANAGSQTQAGNPMQSGQLPSMLPFPLPFPGTSMPLPSLDTPIPDSLNTIVEFINRMEEVLSRNGNQPGQSANDMLNQPPVQLPSNAGGLPLPEAMSIILRRTERLLSGGATRSLSHIAGRLEQESSSTDSSLRSQVQSELVQTGLVMQHLGALFLELGRTMLTVRMGQSPVESVINAGPAVYISPLGPSPIMVQPSSLQVSPLFNTAGNPAAANTGGPLGPIGIFGGAPRHVNIHIHAGATPVPIISARAGTGGSGGGEGVQTEHTGGTGQGDAASMRGFPMRNVIATSVTTRPTAVGISSAQPVIMVSGLQPPDSQNRNAVNPRTGQQQNMSAGLDRDTDVMAGTSEADISITQVQTTLPQSTEASPSTAPNIVSESAATEQKPDVSSNVPLGLGIGGLQTTRRTRPPQTVESSGPSGAPPSSNTLAAGQQILQSLASMRSSPANNNRSGSNAPSPNPQVLSCGMPSSAVDPRASAPQFDMMGMMSQVLQNPAFNNLLSNIGGQTGVGSGDDMRGMLQQFTEDPESMNTINQLAQQMSGQDLPNLLAGSRGRGQSGGGVDLSGMIQQMMPLVTRALSGDNAGPAQAGVVQGDVSRMSARQHDSLPDERNTEINVSEVIQRIAQQSPPQDIMRTMVENSLHLAPGRDMRELVEICDDEGLATSFMETLSHDLRRRVGDGGSQS